MSLLAQPVHFRLLMTGKTCHEQARCLSVSVRLCIMQKQAKQGGGISVMDKILGSGDKVERKWSGIPQRLLGVYRSPLKPFCQGFQMTLAPLSIGLLVLGVKYANFVPPPDADSLSAFSLNGGLAAAHPAEIAVLYALNFAAIGVLSYILRTTPMRIYYDEDEEVYLVCHLHPFIPARLTQTVVPEGTAVEEQEKNSFDFDVICANGRRMFLHKSGFMRPDYYRRLFE